MPAKFNIGCDCLCATSMPLDRPVFAVRVSRRHNIVACRHHLSDLRDQINDRLGLPLSETMRVPLLEGDGTHEPVAPTVNQGFPVQFASDAQRMGLNRIDRNL